MKKLQEILYEHPRVQRTVNIVRDESKRVAKYYGRTLADAVVIGGVMGIGENLKVGLGFGACYFVARMGTDLVDCEFFHTGRMYESRKRKNV